MSKKKYSKSSSFYLKTKKEFFEENTKLFNKVISQNKLYKSQIRRLYCKICKTELGDNYDLKNHGVEYVFCKECNHLNGIYEDSEEFVKKMYIDDEGIDYSENYVDKNFEKRAKDIYLPKIDFLLENLPFKSPKILDIGCGGGYFVFAGLLRNCDIRGTDVGEKLIKFGNKQIFNHFKEKERLIFNSEQQMYTKIETSDSNILSAIGVIEHLREPHKLFNAFKKSKIEFLYYSVPMFSTSVILENVFDQVFPRQLSAGHTHLYTEKSLLKMNNIIGIDELAEWRFGSDSLDLFRGLNVMLRKNKVSEKALEFFNNEYLHMIDKFQKIMDQSHFCSEIHVLGKKFKR